MYLLFLASLTTYVVTSPNPILTPQFYNCTPYFHPNNTVNKTDVDNLFPFEKDSQVNDISRIVLIAIASLNLIWILIGGNFLILIKVKFRPISLIMFCSFKALITDVWTI